MSRNIIFCFSGTGNCLDLAQNIARGIGDTDIVMMRSEPVVKDVSGAETVGFVFPCYGGGAPADFLKYVRQLIISRSSYIYGVSQSASYAGTGLYALNRLVPLDYWRTVTHQCSCIWLFPHTMMMPPMDAEKAQARSEMLATEIAGEILKRKILKKKPPRNLLNVVENKGFGVMLGKKAAGFEVSDSCTGCGQCVQLCPRGNIKLENGRAVIGTNCLQCLGCLQYCPTEAISLGAVTRKREHYHNPNVSTEELSQKLIHID